MGRGEGRVHQQVLVEVEHPRHDHLTVRGDLELRVSIELQRLEQRLVDDECQAVPGAGELLDHGTYDSTVSYVPPG